MSRNILLASAAAALLGVACTPASADTIGLGQWYTFQFGNTAGTPIVGGHLYGTGTSPTAVDSPTAPWTITLTGPATLTVTDVEDSGDVFTLYENGNLLGTTSAPNVNAQNVGECISCALASSNFSHGVFYLPAGVITITGLYDGGVGQGDGDFIITSGTPEPATWALMLAGFAGLGGALRLNRRRSLASPA